MICVAFLCGVILIHYRIKHRMPSKFLDTLYIFFALKVLFHGASAALACNYVKVAAKGPGFLNRASMNIGQIYMPGLLLFDLSIVLLMLFLRTRGRPPIAGLSEYMLFAIFGNLFATFFFSAFLSGTMGCLPARDAFLLLLGYVLVMYFVILPLVCWGPSLVRGICNGVKWMLSGPRRKTSKVTDMPRKFVDMSRTSSKSNIFESNMSRASSKTNLFVPDS